ncbi:MAG: polysaccharide deacetylase family protein [Minisyncoccia bacterium]
MHRYSAIVLPVIFCVALLGGLYGFAQNGTSLSSSVETAFRNDEMLYAEVPAFAAEQSQSVSTSSVTTFKLPILVYHIVRPSYPTDNAAVRSIAHTPEVFDAEMKYLGEAGYHVVSFTALENYSRLGTPLPKKPITISFDDGWDDQFVYAFPILEKYNYTATFFVFTNPIDTKGFITWDELRKMSRAGMTIGSHTRSHPYLTRITDPAKLWNEIDGSKKVLEDKLGITVKEFAYPFGLYDDAIMATVIKAGYLSARGDRYFRGNQMTSRLYELDALNAPTTLELFSRMFP